MKKFLTPVFLLALLAAIMTGCNNNSRLIATGLRVELAGLERTGENTVSVSWHVANPNVVSYLLSHTSHKIYLNSVLLGNLVDPEPLGVPANANADRISKLTVGDATAARALADAVTHGSATYRVDSQLIIRVYDETTEKSDLTNSGTVPVTTK